MLIPYGVYLGQLMLTKQHFIDLVADFPLHGAGYSLVDVTLKDGAVVEQVTIASKKVVCFYDGMRRFVEDEIASLAPAEL